MKRETEAYSLFWQFRFVFIKINRIPPAADGTYEEDRTGNSCLVSQYNSNTFLCRGAGGSQRIAALTNSHWRFRSPGYCCSPGKNASQPSADPRPDEKFYERF